MKKLLIILFFNHFLSFCQNEEDILYESAIQKYDLNDLKGATSDFEKVIEINLNDINLFINLEIIKDKFKRS